MIATTPSESNHPIPKLPPADHPLGWVRHAPFYQAGLAGYSDTAMRLIARKHGCPYCVTEAMLDHFLIQGGKGLDHARLSDDDHPIAGQLMGSHPEDIAKGAKILANLDYDVIDINLACPVKKIKKKCRGGHLLSAPDEAIAILQAVRDAIPHNIPLSLKLRRAYDDTPQMAENFHKILDAAINLDYASTTIHGRTVQQKYIGPAKWPILKQITSHYASATQSGFLIFGSGDVDSPQAIFDMIRQTNVVGASVARGCIGNPWIFEQAHQLLQEKSPTSPDIEQQKNVLLEHFQLSVSIHGEHLAGRMMRKFGIKFSQHHPNHDAVKNAFIKVKNLDDWQTVLDTHYAKNAPGVPITPWTKLPQDTLSE